jgi:hypothetical protein
MEQEASGSQLSLLPGASGPLPALVDSVFVAQCSRGGCWALWVLSQSVEGLEVLMLWGKRQPGLAVRFQDKGLSKGLKTQLPHRE